jgi:hypothetical protein
MGEAKRKQTATQRLIKLFPNCYFCGGQRLAIQREHMPPKCLFDDSHRPDKLVMPVCAECNRGTSTADLAAAIIARWGHGPQSTARALDYTRLAAQIRTQAPELVGEWLSLDDAGNEKALEHLRNHGLLVPRGVSVATVGPLTIRQLNLFAHKATLALYFEHFRQPLPITGRVCTFWRSKEDFARDGIPFRLLEMFPFYATLAQGTWDERKTFEYRYDLNAKNGLFGCIAKLRQGLFMIGFAVTNAEELFTDDTDWISPDDPGTLLNCPRFQEKN